MKTFDRRSFITSGCILGAVGAFGGFIGALAKKSEAKELLRPPGALSEKDFLASCIKCGQCIQVCPYHTLNLLDLSEGVDMGTPAIDPLQRGCYLCDLFPCILCCPSGALDDSVREKKDVQMGCALILQPQKCLAHSGAAVTEDWIAELISHGNRTELEQEFNAKLRERIGKICDLCVYVCPIEKKEEAIRIVNGHPVIFPDCVGCGACVESCPEKLITVKARKTFKDLYSMTHREN